MHVSEWRVADLSFRGAVLLCFALVACSSEPTGQDGDAEASLRIVNVAQTGLSLRLLIDGKEVGSLAFGEATAYFTTAAECEFEARHPITNAILLTNSLRLTADGSSTVLVTGPLTGLTAFVVADAGSLPAAGTVELRVIHMAPYADPFGLYLTEPGADSAQPWVAPFSYESVTPYRPGQPGTYVISTVRAGNGRIGEIMRTYTLALPVGRVRTLVVIDGTNGYMEFVELADFL
jgi:hypothetical protein